jgi:hypothetical protein
MKERRKGAWPSGERWRRIHPLLRSADSMNSMRGARLFGLTRNVSYEYNA